MIHGLSRLRFTYGRKERLRAFPPMSVLQGEGGVLDVRLQNTKKLGCIYSHTVRSFLDRAWHKWPQILYGSE